MRKIKRVILALVMLVLASQAIAQTETFKDTLSATKPTVSFKLLNKYLYVTTKVTRLDTNAVNPDSLKCYNSLDTTATHAAQIAMRSMLTPTTDQTAIDAKSVTVEYFIWNPNIMYLRWALINGTLTGRTVVIETTATRK